MAHVVKMAWKGYLCCGVCAIIPHNRSLARDIKSALKPGPAMPAFITIGRVLFAVLFIFSGASKLLDLAATTQMISAKVVIPDMLAAYSTQLEGLTGMPTAQMLAILAAAVELLCGLAIALNFGARFFAIVLILFVIVATFYAYDFWNQSGPEQNN